MSFSLFYSKNINLANRTEFLPFDAGSESPTWASPFPGLMTLLVITCSQHTDSGFLSMQTRLDMVLSIEYERLPRAPPLDIMKQRIQHFAAHHIEERRERSE